MKLIALAFTAAFLVSSTFAQQDGRPNIVFFMADDWGYNDVGYHNPEILTPIMDSLANSGLILERNYAQPYCTPSRAAFMTGVYPHRIGRQVRKE